MRIQNYDTHYASIQTVLVYPYYIPNARIIPRSHESHSRDAEHQAKDKKTTTPKQSKLTKMIKWQVGARQRQSSKEKRE